MPHHALTAWRRAFTHTARRSAAVLATLLGLAGPALAQATDSTCPPAAQAPTPAQMQTGLREARDRGMLWRLEKDGLVGWLYGTLHVGKLAWAFPGPKVTQALRQAQTVALELDLSDPAIGQALQASLADWRQRQADSPLPPALLARLAALARADCVASTAFEQQPALMQALGLVVLSGRRDGLDPAFAQEFMLGGFAKAGGKTVVSLESPGEQLAAMAPQDPAELQASLAQAVEQLESGQARRLLNRVAEVWARGDMATLARYEDWCECANTAAERDQMRRLNDARNTGLAQAIHAQLLLGKPVFAAVGALHMTGPQALPRLMAERGWTVQRVPFDPM
jgi:uncharacterized protein YbaP (TraB family)